jgi:hypothetical protein
MKNHSAPDNSNQLPDWSGGKFFDRACAVSRPTRLIWMQLFLNYKPTHRFFFCSFLFFSGFWLNATSCLWAASISWNPPANIVSDADVSTNGSLVYACDISGAAATINTVPFAGSFSGNVTVTGSAGSVANSFAGGTSAPWSGLSANYQTVLQGGYYAANNTALSVTLGGLTVGTIIPCKCG